MADAVATQILVDDTRRAVFKFTNISDGTGETGVVKIDVSALSSYQGNACTSVAIQTLDAVTLGFDFALGCHDRRCLFDPRRERLRVL
jgi:hypothetical protein